MKFLPKNLLLLLSILPAIGYAQNENNAASNDCSTSTTQITSYKTDTGEPGALVSPDVGPTYYVLPPANTSEFPTDNEQNSTPNTRTQWPIVEW